MADANRRRKNEKKKFNPSIENYNIRKNKIKNYILIIMFFLIEVTGLSRLYETSHKPGKL